MLRTQVGWSAAAVFALGTAACQGTIGGGGTGGDDGSGAGGSGAGNMNMGGYGVPPTPEGPIEMISTPRLARLSHLQWANTLRDLLRLDSAPAQLLRADAVTESSFDNAADLLSVDQNLWIDYQKQANQLAAQVAGSAAALARIEPANPPTDLTARGRAFITEFGKRAYRRPLTAAEVTRYAALFAQGGNLLPAAASPFAAGAELVLRAMLQSPHFLYRTELATGAVDGKIPLTPYEVASKLSYALIASMPDDALFAAAEDGSLGTAAGILAQAQRLMSLGDARASLDSFHRQHLQIKGYVNITKDRTRFPEFTATLPAAMANEALLFMADIVNSGKTVADALTGSHTFVNAELAPLYGVQGSFTAAEFKRVDLDPGQRAGLLTRLGLMTLLSEESFPLPILRGLFVNKNILCRHLPPPNPMAASVAEMFKRQAGQQNREYFDGMTGAGTCGAPCHPVILNPPGYAFEHYDGLGRYRAQDAARPVDASGTFELDGKTVTFADGLEFSRQLAGSQEAHACMSQGWTQYLMGLSPSDTTVKTFLERMGRSLGERSAAGRSLRAIILDMVTSDYFLTRLP